MADEDYLVLWKPVSLITDEDAGALVVDVLAGVHESVPTAYAEAATVETMEDARGLVRAFRLSEGNRSVP